MSYKIYLTILYIFFCAKYLTKLYLNFRNIKAIRGSSVPDEFSDMITPADHLKATHYSIEKLSFSQIQILLEILMFSFWIIFGGYKFIDNLLQVKVQSELYRGLLFFGSIALIDMIISTPFSLYSKFVIEQKYGFNKMTYTKYCSDLFKQIVLGIVIGLPLLTAILYIIINTKTWWLWAFLLFVGFQFFILWLYPTFIAPIFNKFTLLEEESLKKDINSLLEKVGFQSKGLFVMDASIRSSHGNAYFTGFGKSKRIVFFDTLLDKLQNKEVIAILAHELGHFKRKHILKMMIKSIFFLLIGFFTLGMLHKNPDFYQVHYGLEMSSYMAIALFTIITPIFTFFLTPISSYLSRKNEYEADEFAALNSDARDLISGLKILYKENSSPVVIDPLYSKFYYSHPAAIERVNFLKTFISP
jgi:STE24 endopeptidase